MNKEIIEKIEDQDVLGIAASAASSFTSVLSKDEIDTCIAPHDQQQALNLEFFEKRISSLEERIETLRDQIATLKANGGHTP